MSDGVGSKPSLNNRGCHMCPFQLCVLFTCCFFIWQNGRMAVWLKFKPPVRGFSDPRASAIARRLASSPGKGPGAAAAGVRWWVAGRRGLPGPGSELHFLL